jgi:hypothetical protein
MFEVKTRSLPKRSTFQFLHSVVSYGLAHEHKTKLERLAKDKHYSLLEKLVNYDHKKLYNIWPWADFMNILR